MAKFNDLATELQIAIWELVLPYRGMHWVEIEGFAHEASYVRDSLRITRDYGFGDNVPEALHDLWFLEWSEEQMERRRQKSHADDYSGSFFRKLVPVVPAVWGRPGPGIDQHHLVDGGTSEIAKEVAYTRRCRQLSVYTLVTTLLSTCHLSRAIAIEYILRHHHYSYYVYRSMGALHRPRPLEVWEEQYRNVDDTDPGPQTGLWKLIPQIHNPLDLVVFRLHDSEGRATSTLRLGPWQFHPESVCHQYTFAWFDRVALEWHPRWAEPGPDGSDQFCAGNVAAIMNVMSDHSTGSTMLYWLVDGIPKPNWDHDYPKVVGSTFRYWNARWRHMTHRWSLADRDTFKRCLADATLEDLEFNANGRRYYIVFVVIHWDFPLNPRQYVEDTSPGTSIEGPFLGGEEIWPEKLRAPAKFAHEMLSREELNTLSTNLRMSFILSWEPV